MRRIRISAYMRHIRISSYMRWYHHRHWHHNHHQWSFQVRPVVEHGPIVRGRMGQLLVRLLWWFFMMMMTMMKMMIMIFIRTGSTVHLNCVQVSVLLIVKLGQIFIMIVNRKCLKIKTRQTSVTTSPPPPPLSSPSPPPPASPSPSSSS